jgi:uncharacterized protein
MSFPQSLVCVAIFCLTTHDAISQTPAASLIEQGQQFESWYGDLDAGPRVLRFLIQVRTDPAGKQSAKLLSKDEGDAEFELDDLLMSDAMFSFEIKSTKAAFSGGMNPAKDTIEGKWTQRGATLPMKLRKVDSPPKEIWLGTMQAGFQKLVMQFRIYADPSGNQTALIDSVSQKAGGFKAAVKIDGNQVTLDSPSLKSKFVGEKDATGDELNGKWTQGIAFDLRMKRIEIPVDAKSVQVKRPQTPKAPFPYDSNEVTFKNSSAGIELAGTLSLPKSNKPLAAAILISGSGPQDRDETLLDHKPFAVLADYLNRNGIAVLRYDDRGVGKSTGSFDRATTADFVTDVEAAIEFLKSESKIDPKQIGLIGHSEGGLIAPSVAAKHPELAWIVLMAGPGVNGEEVLYSQGQLIVAANGGDKKLLRKQKTIQKVGFDHVKELEPGQQIPQSVVDACAAKVLDEIVKSGDAPEGEELVAFKKTMAEESRGVLTTANTPWMRYFLTYEPGPALEKTKCPVLAINGEKDLQVDPKLNLAKIESALKSGGNKDFKIQELAGLNHLFQKCGTGSPNEYASIEETLSPQFLDAVGSWLKNRIQ